MPTLPTAQGFWSNTNERREGVPGTNGSLTFTIPAGVANINTTIKQFGTGSMWGNTGGGYIQTTTSSSSMDVGNGDFTVEGWVYIPAARANNQTADIIVNNKSQGLGIRFGPTYNNTGANSFNNISVFARSGTDGPYANITWPRDQWNHFVAQRNANATGQQYSFWVNGRKLTINGGGNLNAQNFATTTTGPLTIGNYNSGGTTDENLRGVYVDELTVAKGIARYDTVGNIVVPVYPFNVDQYTGILMHMDGTSGSTTFVNATS